LIHRNWRANPSTGSASLRAGARNSLRTRADTPCRGPADGGRKRRAAMGGAPGACGQPGNRNRLKQGLYTVEMMAARR
jgi:hypothetical protein